MIRATRDYVEKPPPIPSAYIDGYLYCGIAFFGALTAAFGSDEANKFISSDVLFWLRTLCGSASATLLALKMFRSDSFARHKEEMKAKGDTQVFTNPNPPATPAP